MVDWQQDGLKPMRSEHLDEVMSVELAAYVFPWSKGNFADCLSSHYQCWIYQPENTILAYSVLSMAAGEAHVLNLCVHPKHQNRGLGRKMLEFLLLVAKQHQVMDIFLEVRDSNEAAKALYESIGFNQYAERKNYYPAADGREHAVLYCKAVL